MSKKYKAYVSDIDQQLAKFDQTHPLSAAQQAEIDKYNEIYAKRDKASLSRKPVATTESKIWEDF